MCVLVPHGSIGPFMTLYWMLPEIIPAPKTVEPVSSMVKRSRSFIEDLKKVFMEQGVIAVEGTPDEVFDSENARMQGFLGKFREK